MNPMTETKLYYAIESSGEDSSSGKEFYNEYIFESESEAVKSGHKYEVVTWNDINMAANCGIFYKDMIIVTPQGKFIWTEIEDKDISDETVVNDCMYRAVGAPVALSEAVEYHLFWSKGSELIGIVEETGEFKAEIQNSNGEKVIIKGR